MIRTQIQLDEEQARAIRQRAAAEGRSVAEIIRTAVDLLLASHRQPDRADLKRRAIEVAGRFASGRGHVASDHDQYLDEAYRR